MSSDDEDFTPTKRSKPARKRAMADDDSDGNLFASDDSDSDAGNSDNGGDSFSSVSLQKALVRN